MSIFTPIFYWFSNSQKWEKMLLFSNIFTLLLLSSQYDSGRCVKYLHYGKFGPRCVETIGGTGWFIQLNVISVLLGLLSLLSWSTTLYYFINRPILSDGLKKIKVMKYTIPNLDYLENKKTISICSICGESKYVLESQIDHLKPHSCLRRE